MITKGKIYVILEICKFVALKLVLALRIIVILIVIYIIRTLYMYVYIFLSCLIDLPRLYIAIVLSDHQRVNLRSIMQIYSFT